MRDLSDLIERVRKAWRPKPSLKWSVQFATYSPKSGDALLHFAFCPIGTFEIFDDQQGNFLLHFPKQLLKPADLFRDLQSAKIHAEMALQESSK